MMRCIANIAILLWLPIAGLMAQGVGHISGTILNSETKKPVSFATIIIQGTDAGTTSDEKGRFTVSFHPDYGTHLEISYLGYETKVISIREIVKADEVEVHLDPKVYEIDGVTVTGSDGQKIVKEAIHRMRNNYPQNQYITEAFYRQYHKENGQYVRLIEANVTLFHRGKTPFNTTIQQELVAVNQLRRSHNFERNDEVHGDHLIDLLLENSIKYNAGTCLDDGAIKRYNYALDSVVKINGKLAYLVSFASNYTHAEQLESGSLIIDYDTYGILEVRVDAIKNDWPSNYQLLGSERYTWEFKSSSKHITFQPKNGKLYLETITMHYEHDLYNNQFRSIDFTIEEDFELYIDSTYAGSKEAYSTALRPKKWTNLYHAPYHYDSTFWANYDTPQLYPLQDSIVIDMEKYSPLEAQYESTSRR